jgi:hypothetical protein
VSSARVYFVSDLCRRALSSEDKRRKTVAATFFELLVLKSKSYIEIAQDAGL